MSHHANMATRPVHERVSRDGSVVAASVMELGRCDGNYGPPIGGSAVARAVTGDSYGDGEWRGPSNMAVGSLYEACLSRLQLC